MEAFESETQGNAKKINKSTLIQMLEMTTLFQLNKTSVSPEKSLIDILVNYLKNKFRLRVEKIKEKQNEQNENAKKIERKYSAGLENHV